jgi:hypothetical protein
MSMWDMKRQEEQSPPCLCIPYCMCDCEQSA